MGQHKFEADQQRGRDGGPLHDVQPARPAQHQQRTQNHQRAHRDVHGLQPVVLAPDREGRLALGLVAHGARPEGPDAVGAVEEHHPSRQQRGQHQAGDVRQQATRPRGRVAPGERMPGPQRHEDRRHDLRGHAEADHQPPPEWSRGQHQSPRHARRDQGIVGVARQREGGERERGPCDGEGEAHLPARQAPPQHQQRQQREAVEQHRRTVRRRQVVPLARVGHDGLERHVRDVVERPIGVALAAVVGEVPVGRLAVLDEVGADHPGVPHIDHVAVQAVQAPPQRHEQDEHGHQQPGGHPPRKPRPAHHRRLPLVGGGGGPSPAGAGHRYPHHACEQVDEGRVLHRHRRGDIALVEPRPRRRERQKHQQVEGAPREQGARARDGQQHQQEHHAQGNPDAPAVHRPPERALVSPGHHPGHLRPRAHLGDVALLIAHVHLGLHHLGVLGAADERHLPALVLLLQLGRGAADGVVGDPCLQPRVGLGDGGGLLAGERGLVRAAAASRGCL